MADAAHHPEEHVRQSRPEDTGHRHGSTTGRATSWIAVALVILGFILGGVGLIVLTSVPWLLWVGVALAVGGLIFGFATGIMDDVH